MNNKLTNDNFSFLTTIETDMEAIHYNGTSINYSELKNLVDEKHHELGALNGKKIVINYTNPIQQITMVLAVIEAGGYAIVTNSENEISEESLVKVFNKEELYIATDSEEVLVSTILQQLAVGVTSEKSVEKGGVILVNNSVSEVYQVEINEIQEHVSSVIQTLELEKGAKVLATKALTNVDVLEYILPAITAQATLYISNETARIATEIKGIGTLKITTKELNEEALEKLSNSCDFEITKVIIAANEKVSGAAITKLKAAFPKVEKITAVYQLKNVYYSVLQSDNLLDLKENEIAVYTKPIGKINVQILDAKLRPAPIGVLGELWIESKVLNIPLIENAKMHELHIGGADRKLRVLEHRAKFESGGKIALLNKKDRELLINEKIITPDVTEENLQLHPQISKAVVVFQEAKNLLIAFIEIAKEEELTVTTVRNWIKRKVSRENMPAHFEFVDKLPVLNNDIDYTLLENTEVTVLPKAEVSAEQQQLVTIWEELLGVSAVELDDNFFELGGHSILATKLVSLIRKEMNTEVSIKTIFTFPTIEMLTEVIALNKHKSLIPSVKSYEKKEYLPLSYSQQRLWFLDKLQGTREYHISGGLRLQGVIEEDLIEASLQIIIERHGALRTVIKEKEGIGYQEIIDAKSWNLSKLTAKKNQTEQDVIKMFTDIPFDLSKDYMFRAGLHTINEHESLLVLVFHHVSSDGWSIPIFIDEFISIYDSLKNKTNLVLQKLPIQYADYAIWQRKYIGGELLETQLTYWKEKLTGVSPLMLPFDYERSKERSTQGELFETVVDKELVQKLQELSSNNGSTLFMTLLSVYKILLFRYSGQQDICVGTPIAGRIHQEFENLIGFFVNTLAIRSQVDTNSSFESFLREVKENSLEAYKNQEAPFEKVVEVTTKERDLVNNPLLQVLFSLENMPVVTESALSNFQVKVVKPTNIHVQSDLHFVLEEDIDKGLVFEIHYRKDLFKKSTIQQLANHYLKLLASVAECPTEKIGKLKMLGDEEITELLQAFNPKSDVQFSENEVILETFSSQAIQKPNATALIFGNNTITYAELDEKSNQLANYLQGKGVKKGDFIPICMERSILTVVSIFGIIKCGAAYVPIDPSNPNERISFITNDIEAEVLITTSDLLVKVKSCTEIECILVEEIQEELKLHSKDKLNINITQDDVAYIIYTSGTTGVPKGAVMQHGALNSFLTALQYTHPLTSKDRMAFKTNYGFDMTIPEIFGWIKAGASAVIFSDEQVKDVTLFSKELEKQEVTQLHMVPSHFSVFLDYVYASNIELPALKYLLVGGEAFPEKALQIYKNSKLSAKLDNIYGPTETTAYMTFFPVNEKSKNYSTLPIGKPMPNATAYILSDNMELLPKGVVGELCIGGLGLSKGYLKREDLTNEKFVVNPFNTNERLYKTGDLTKWLPDGNISYVGRKDSQVKIRGYRVELGEIENVLSKYHEIQQSCVITNQDIHGTKYLVGYFVSEKDIAKETLQGYLSAKLPDYMVPRIWVKLAEMPLGSSGKIDKKKLPLPNNESLSTTEYLAPRNEQEEKLTEIWEKLLEVERIGVNDNFFELGGHSLLATRLVSMIRKETGVEIPIRTIFTHPTISLLSENLGSKNLSKILPPITSKGEIEKVPLSYNQQRMWFLDQLQGTREYHVSGGVRIHGNIDIDLLEIALRTIVERHEILRTVIEEVDGVGYQKVISYRDWNLSSVVIDEKSQEKILIDEFLNIPFNLAKDFTFRACLYDLGEDEYILACVFHHIASDGWSIPIFIDELTDIFGALHTEKELILPKLSLQYSDYAVWQREHIEGEFLENQLSYWENKLKGVTPLTLPTDFVRPSVQSRVGSNLYFELDKSLKDSLVKMSQEEGVTLFMLLLSAFKILLFKYSGQNDICVGTPIANRTQSDIEGMIGFFVNTIALRSSLEEKMNFKALLEEVKKTTLESYDYQMAPFDKVVERIGESRDMSITQVFQVMFDLHNIPEQKKLKIDGVNFTPYEFEEDTAQYDLILVAKEHKEGISLNLEYCSDLFEQETAQRMLYHYEMLLRSIVTDNKQSVASLSILTNEEKEQLLYDFNATKVNYPLHLTFVDLFNEQVQKTPDNIALSFKGQAISYKELDEKSNQIAHCLVEKGVGEDDLVAICLERSFSMITGIIGILKAGAAYVPIKPDYPESRIKHILSDINSKLLITDKQSKNGLNFANQSNVDVIVLDSESKEFDEYPKTKLNIIYNPDSLSYIIYTSGSTGTPKGALIEHKGLLNHLLLMIDELKLNEESVIGFTAPFTFDISVWQILSALLVGGKTAIYKEEDLLQIKAFGDALYADKVTILQLVPSYTSSLLEASTNHRLDFLKYFLVTGEAVTKDILDRWFSVYPNIPVVNAYGPAEASDDVTLHIMTESPKEGLVPIGKPVANMQLYVVDNSGELCPIGVIGELWVGGIGIGRGYLNLESLTKEKFVENKFTGEGRLYKTGDLGCWLSDGTLEFVGRSDDQVKVRGHRIELGEIENILSVAQGVTSCCVLAKEDATGNNNLLGYVVMSNGVTFDKTYLENHLQENLPDYMVPRLWVQLSEMPLTPNGKIDKKNLPDIEYVNEVDESYEVPRNEVETILLKIWQELLGIEAIGINDNFFELGGHSLKVISMVSQIQKELEAEVAISDIFGNPTISTLAELIGVAEEVVYEEIPKIAEAPYYPVSNAQKRLWILDRLVDEVSGYNTYNAYSFEGNINVEAFGDAVLSVVNRHEVLRTTFAEKKGEPVQIIHNKVLKEQIFSIIDYSNTKVAEQEIIKELTIEANNPFDLEKPFLFKSKMFLLGENKYIFFCSMHHIICDGWSNPILVKEILTNYKSYINNYTPNLPLLRLHYKDYAAWQLNRLVTGAYEPHKKYWHEKLAGDLPVLNFPTYKQRPLIQDFSGKAIEHYFNKVTLNKIKSLVLKEETSLYMALVSFLNILFYKYTGQTDIILGTGTAGRTHPDLEDQIGFYISTLPLRNSINPEATFIEFLKEVSSKTLEAFEHQDYPFDRLVNELDIERDISRNPIFDVMILLQSFDEDEDQLLINGFEGVKIKELPVENQGSPFDMDFDFTEEKDQLKLMLTYNDTIYSDEQMQDLLVHLELLINRILENPNQKNGEVSISTSEEITLIEEINNTEKKLPLEKTFHHYLEQFAKETPHKTAVIFEDRETSYSLLNAKSNQLARAITTILPVQEDDQVGVLLERSDLFMATILGIWKLGGSYIPIDKKVPDNRVLAMVDIAKVSFVIADKNLISDELKEKIPTYCKLVYIQDLVEVSQNQNSENLDIDINPHSLSVTMFTSGSTGLPKGAMNEHIGMMNHALATVDYLSMNENSVLVQNASLSFDIAVWQFFTALITGGTTAIYGDELVNAPELLLQKFIEHKVTVFQVVPSYLSMLVDVIAEDKESYPFTISHLISCGEAVKPKSIAQWLSYYPNTTIINDYGPAEASDGTTWNVFNSVDENATSIPVGKPIYNMANYIVDDYMNLCPIGVIGEICVAGIGVGRGYINDKEKTEKVFITNPFKKEVQERLYKTGDLGRILPNGMVEFRGRKDYQVKVNGQRIELGEIESKLLQLAGVKEATVIDRINEHNGRKYLHAFVVFEDSSKLNIENIKITLSQELPPYMIPADFQELSELPLTMSGKVDRKYLDKVAVKKDENDRELERAENDFEVILLKAWKITLHLEEIGTTDNFYQIGGDSISAIQVSSFLYKHKYQIDVKDIMRYPTIKEAANFVKPLLQIANQGVITGEVPLTPIQAAFFQSQKNEAHHYNQSMVLKSSERIDAQILEETLRKIQSWHDVLRTTYSFKDDLIKQEIQEDGIPVALTVHDLMEENSIESIHNLATKIQSGISLEEGPLMHSVLFRLKDADYVLIAIHHLVIDAVSWRIILEDFANIYEKLTKEEEIDLPAKTHSFKEWSEELRAYMVSEEFEEEKIFWNSRIKENIQQIPYDNTTNQTYKGKVEEVSEKTIYLSEEYVNLFETKVHKAFNTGANDILLTALMMSIKECFSLNETAIMLESHGRATLNEDITTNRTVGWFTSEFPVYLSSQTNDLGSLLKEIKENLHKIPNYGIGFGIAKYIDINTSETYKKSIIPQIAFNFLGSVNEGDEAEVGFELLDNTFGVEESYQNQSDYAIEILGSIRNKKMELTIQYHKSQFKDETIANWLKVFKESLEELISFCANREHTEATPSDYDYSDLSLDDLVELNDLF
ncbi:amino acid adenylation domain-containing protein [Tenacibaculum sp. TC6]|uniref:amino acid adenylation domain-containing protein n=1 Tax=Tenacibaculum sp. TC6 TaxID=3423223 RepID=UPI003D35D801